MKVAIRVTAKDNAKALDILIRNYHGMALRDRIFIVSDEAVKALKKAGVKFKEIARDGLMDIPEGGPVGTRI